MRVARGNSIRGEEKMIVCRRCGGRCDNGEIVKGICLECAEEERQQQIRAREVSMIMMEDMGYAGNDRKPYADRRILGT